MRERKESRPTKSDIFLEFGRRIRNTLSTSVFIRLNKTDCGEIDGGQEAQPQ